MIIIKLYTVLGELGIDVNSTMPPLTLRSGNGAVTPLHHAYTTIDEPPSTEELCQMIKQALEHIDGYAGDLWDHVDV